MLHHFLSPMIVIFISPVTVFAVEMAENIFIISMFVDRRTTISLWLKNMRSFLKKLTFAFCIAYQTWFVYAGKDLMKPEVTIF